jgi:hypothetical protein
MVPLRRWRAAGAARAVGRRPLGRRTPRRLLGLVAGAAAVGVLLAPTLASAADGVVWSGDFDRGAVPPWSSNTGSCPGGTVSGDNQYQSVEGEGNVVGKCPAVSLVTDRTRSGSGRAMRVHMPPGTKRATPSSTYRWDVPGTANGELDQYVGMSVYFEQGFPGSTWISPISWRTTDKGSLVVQKKGSNLVFRRSVNTSWDGCAANTACSNDDLDMGPIVQGKWIDFVFRVRYSAQEDTGIRQVWRDGVLMGTSTKRNVLDGSTYRLRVGMYQDDSTTVARTLYYDNVRIGSSYNAVNPAPLPAGSDPVSPASEPAPSQTTEPSEPADPSTGATFVGATSATDSGTEDDTVTLTSPSASMPGDLLLAAVSFRGNPRTISAPPGWTLVERRQHTTANIRTEVYRLVQPSGAHAWSWKSSSSSDGGSAVIAAYRGASEVVAQGSQQNAASLDASAPSLDNDKNGLLVTAFAATGRRTFSPPPGMLERADVADPDGAYSSSTMVADTPVVAGPTGIRAARVSSSVATNGVSVLVR